MISLTKLLNTFCILPHFFLKFLKFKIILREIHYLCNIEGTSKIEPNQMLKTYILALFCLPKRIQNP